MTKRLLIYPVLFLALLLGANTGAYAQTYCSVSSSSCGSDYVGNVTTTGGTNNISNSSGCTSGGYIYYSSIRHAGVLGGTVGYTITMGSLSEYIGIWVDFNQNGSFTDAGEQIYVGTARESSKSGSFTIPTTALTGTTRMRVGCDWSTSPSSCGSRTWGEHEDYNFEILSPCAGITGLSAPNVFARTAVVSWNAVNGSAGYEYMVKTTAGAPTGSGTAISTTSVNIGNLNPATTYYVYVRNKCNATSFSIWSMVSFTTSNCVAPEINFANIDDQSATAIWSNIVIAQQYEYTYGINPNPPSSGATGTTYTTGSSFQMQGLTPNTTYYVHIRTHCIGNETSSWETYQFNTMETCQAPSLTLIKLSNLDMRAEWQPVPTAVAYEYALSTFDTPPALGNTVYINEALVTIPDDNLPYYLHVRTKCISIFNTSDWSTVTLREPPITAVTNINNNNIQLIVFPNPVKEKLTVKIGGKESKGTITISDVTGKVLSTTLVNAAIVNLSVENLPTGMYMIRYQDQNANNITSKFVKN